MSYEIGHLGDGTADDLERTFDVLAHSWRLVVIGELERKRTATVGELAERVADHEDCAVEEVKIDLVHNHIPRLEAADVVTFDPAAREVEFDDASAVRDVLTAVDRHVEV